MTILHHAARSVQPESDAAFLARLDAQEAVERARILALYPPVYDEADAAWWAAETGAPEGVPPAEPLLPFADWIELEASLIRLDGSNAATWLAGKMDELAATARLLGADTPDQFDGRLELEEDCRDMRLRDEGYEVGLRDR